jgi:hypothetical protein
MGRLPLYVGLHILALAMWDLGCWSHEFYDFFAFIKEQFEEIDQNQITFGTIDFQPHPPTLASVFARLGQEMDLTIRSFNFRVGSLGSLRLSDSIPPGRSASKIASALA